MEKTNIEHFNSFLKQFIENIMETFDEYKEIIQEYYKELLETEKCSDDKYVKRFLNKTKDFKTHISEENDDMFKEDIYLLKNVNFKTLWASGEIVKTTKKKYGNTCRRCMFCLKQSLTIPKQFQNLLNNLKMLRRLTKRRVIPL